MKIEKEKGLWKLYPECKVDMEFIQYIPLLGNWEEEETCFYIFFRED